MTEGMNVENVPENLLVVEAFRVQQMDALSALQETQAQTEIVAERVTMIEFHGHLNGTQQKVSATVCLTKTAAGMLLSDLIDGSL